MSYNPLPFQYHNKLLAKVAVLVSAAILKQENKNFKIDDLSALEDHYSCSTNIVTAGPYYHGEASFYIDVKIKRTAGKASTRAMMYMLELEAYSKFGPNTPEHTQATAHLAVGHRNKQGDGSPGRMEQLMEFVLTPHPVTAAVDFGIAQDDVISSAGDDEENLNPLAKDLADQILLHI